MKKWLGRFWYFITGWKLIVPDNLHEVSHSVMVAAPHTSNWDFIYAISAFWTMDLKMHYFIKDSYTKSWLGWFFKLSGALGVDRSQQNKLVEQAAQIIKDENKMVILVPAEGSRSFVEKWKTGFYHIAIEAKVPISLGFLDFKKKEGGILEVFYPSGDFSTDMRYIESKFEGITGKIPENYNPIIFDRNEQQ